VSPQISLWPGVLGRITTLLGALAGVFLVVALVLVVAGVAFRYLLNAPIFGGAELVQFASVGMVMCAIPYCGASDGHIRVDIFDRLLGRTGRLIGEVIYVAAALAVLFFLVTRAWRNTLEAIEYEDATNILDLPIWPMQALIVLGAVIFGAVLIGRLIYLLTDKAHAHE
tara:strand:+ start:44761 stop:45267 length:507 start_codon:yes stop_codon:yes gene_type:complete